MGNTNVVSYIALFILALLIGGLYYLLLFQNDAKVEQQVKQESEENKIGNDLINVNESQDEALEVSQEQKSNQIEVRAPVFATCGLKEFEGGLPKVTWVAGSSEDCTEAITEEDSLSYTVGWSAVPRGGVESVEAVFEIPKREGKVVTNLEAEINMICNGSLEISTLTEFGQWKTIPDVVLPRVSDYYYTCPDSHIKERIVARVEPQDRNGTVFLLINPGTGNTEAIIDKIRLNITYR